MLRFLYSMTNKLMIFCICVSVASQPTSLQKRWNEIESGNTLAWAEHITGQDTDTHTTWHDFKSVAVIHGRSAKANGDTREDDEVWAVVDRGSLGTFIEQFQALDWGEDDDYCWFVDAGIGDANSLGRDAILDIPAVPPAATRDEAYVVTNEDTIVWFDIDWNVLSYENVNAYGGGFTFFSYGCLDVDSDGVVVAGFQSASVDSLVGRWDADLNVDMTFFLPDAGWPADGVVTGVKFSPDELYLYAKRDGGLTYKFDASNGDQIWREDLAGVGNGFDIDSSGNLYTASGSSVRKYDSDATLLYTFTPFGAGPAPGGAPRCCVYDETSTKAFSGGTWVVVGGQWGLPNPTSVHLIFENLANDDGGYWQGSLVSGLLVVGTNIYATHGRTGTPASVTKFDEDLNVLAQYDTGYSSKAIWLDHDGNIAVSSGDFAIGDTNAGMWILDTDLNYIADYNYNTDVLYHNQGAAIPYLDDGTALIPGTPGVEPNYVDVNDYFYGDVCVYADGIPLGTFTVFEDANGTSVLDLGGEYDVVILGINYYSIYESFPLIPQGEYSSIKDVKIDFYETMGCNVGVTLDDAVDWEFSDDDFATSIDAVTEIKTAPFVWGSGREPVIYLWLWEPIPMSLRSINPKINVSIE